MNASSLPIAIIGAGPIGLAAAAHLVERGETPLILEAGSEVAANVRDWGHVRFFSPWKYALDDASVRLLEATGWEKPEQEHLPLGNELIGDYLAPLAALPEIAPHIQLNTRVTAISRRRIDKMKNRQRNDAPFTIRAETPSGARRFHARAVIDASGTWQTPNPLGSDGLPAENEHAEAAHIVYGIPDVLNKQYDRYANKRIAVVGGGHSAINALLELGDIQSADAPATKIDWILRKGHVNEAYGGLEDDELPGRGALGMRIKELVDAGRVVVHTPFYITALERINGQLHIVGDSADGEQTLPVDEIISATGARPDLGMLSELRLDLDPAVESPSVLAPMIDPNFHSCGSVDPHGANELKHPENDFYIVGMKSYGRAPTFLLLTGYEQIRSVAAALVGDTEAANAVQLQLPDTGVCCVPELEPAIVATTTRADDNGAAAAAACCAPATISLETLGIQTAASACCAPASVAVDTQAADGQEATAEACCTPAAKVKQIALNVSVGPKCC